MNSVPTATISLALGREVNSLRPSLAHQLELGIKVPVKVYMRAKKTSSSVNVERWPGGDFLLFDGDVIASGYVKSNQAVNLALSLIHWLARLSSGSCLSGTSHPSNATDVTFRAGTGPLCAGASAFAGGEVNAEVADFAQKALNGDFWEGGIQDWFICMAQQEALDTNRLLPGGAEPSKRPDLIPTIKRIKSGVKISLNKKSANVLSMTFAMASDLAARAKSPQDLLASTFWDLLLSILGGYQLALVPRIEDALIVPFVSGLRTSYGTVQGTDFAAFAYQAGLSKPLRGVTLLSSGTADTFAANATSPKFPGGTYENKKSPNGLMFYRSLPGWLQGDNAGIEYSSVTVGAGGVKANAINPEAGKAAPGDKPGKKEDSKKSIRDDLAQVMYIDEALRSRQTSISEQRFRLDLAPGSVVRLEAVGEKFVGKDSTRGILYGTIAQVTCVLNSESGGAGTAYAINNIRTAKENTDDSYSIASHPIWTNFFTGTGLR